MLQGVSTWKLVSLSYKPLTEFYMSCINITNLTSESVDTWSLLFLLVILTLLWIMDKGYKII